MKLGEITAVCVLSILTILTLCIVIGGCTMIRGNNATQEAVNAVGEQITNGFQGLKEELGKKPTVTPAVATPVALLIPVTTRVATPVLTASAVPSGDISTLTQELGETAECVWKQAGEQLQKYGLTAVPQLIKVLEMRDPVGYRAKWCLIHIGPASLDELVNIGFASKNPEAREAAISAVVTIGGYEAREKLKKASWNLSRPLVRHTAHEALDRLDAKEMERTSTLVPPPQPPAKDATKSRP